MMNKFSSQRERVLILLTENLTNKKQAIFCCCSFMVESEQTSMLQVHKRTAFKVEFYNHYFMNKNFNHF